MKNNKLVFLILSMVLLFGGCKKVESIDNPKALTTSPSPISSITVAPTIPPTVKPSATPTIEVIPAPTVTPIIHTLTTEELSMEAYEKFMKNEMKVSFDRYMPRNDREEDLYKKGSQYTLSELLKIVTEHYLNNSANKQIEFIDYSYIDCGKDRVNELILRFNGMDINDKDDDSTLVYIIKYVDEKLFVCYYYETWARSESTINEYGYIQSSGSNGASNHTTEYSLVDKDGNWQFIVSVESELDVNMLYFSDELGQIPQVAESKGISGEIELDTICFNKNENVANSDEIGNEECFYTFYVYDDNWELIEDESLYTHSKYKEIFEEALVPFITPEEVSNMISEKEEKAGATADIKEGAEIIWKSFSENIFSDYVVR